MTEETILDIAKRIKSISDIGLLYSPENSFDKERYRELKELSEKIIGGALKLTPEISATVFTGCADYPTPKVDIRALVLNDKKEILMVQEKADNCWSLPGGWADIGKTPSEIAIQEVFEETGIKVSCKHLAAVFDKRMYPHPPQPWYVYKMFFYCGPDDAAIELKPAFDMLGAGWFSIDALPPLSKDRVLEEQIKTIYSNIITNNFTTLFD
ncbi:NUDIX hydrolase N-terminal domain-containing protein [Parafilimonas sp.]|uniref:NUDIX hydrolase N-terminal domain-containing protein n=1 Tax=Parafilimonas sp. TaxID=1969739 RepID=UPI0039E484F5